MKKNIKKIFAILIVSVLCIPYTVKADIEKIIGSMYTGTSEAEYTYATGSRQSTMYGVRLSLIECGSYTISGDTSTCSNPKTILVYDVFTRCDEGHSTSSTTNKMGEGTNYKNNIDSSGACNPGVIKTINLSVGHESGKEWNLNFTNISDQFDTMIEKANDVLSKLSDKNNFKMLWTSTQYYKFIQELAELAGSKNRYLCDDTTCSVDRVNEYFEKINKVYVMAEPISTVKFGSPYAWHGDTPIPDTVIKNTRTIGNALANAGLSEIKKDDIYKKDSVSNTQAILVFKTVFKTAYLNGIPSLAFAAVLSDTCEDKYSTTDCANAREYVGMYIDDFNNLWKNKVKNIKNDWFTDTTTKLGQQILNKYNGTDTKKLRGLMRDPVTEKEVVM